MTPDEFNFLAALIKKRSGLALTEDKRYLLETRLQPIARDIGLNTISELVNKLRSMPSEELLRNVTEAMTTNESMFFRDNRPFEQLKTILLPKLKEKNAMTRRLRFWNAACSNGQEPYSLAITLLEEQAKMLGWAYEIQASDLDTQVLKKAAEGIYSQFEVQRGMPIQLLLKYFTKEENNNWQLKPEIRKMVNFQQGNLLASFTNMGKFDIIMCRNVLIYFDDESKRDVMERLAACLNPHGYLFLGAAESCIGLTTKLRPMPDARGVFELNV
jgi:chemotaxis protein methyltransferase CheR